MEVREERGCKGGSEASVVSAVVVCEVLLVLCVAMVLSNGGFECGERGWFRWVMGGHWRWDPGRVEGLCWWWRVVMSEFFENVVMKVEGFEEERLRRTG